MTDLNAKERASSEYFSLFENFSEEERTEFERILNGRVLDENEATNVLLDSIIKKYNKEHEKSLSDYVDDNENLARLLITAFERYEMKDSGELLEKYVFDNKDSREDFLQRKLLTDMVKKIRSLTGLSQAKFAAQYEINKRSLQAWELGAKKITKYAYNYLKSAITSNATFISTIRQVNLPIYILDEKSIKYLRTCSKWESEAPDAIVRHVKESPWMGEAYILYLEKYETVENRRVKNQWDCFPEGLKKCIRPFLAFNISEIVFDFDEEHYTYYKELIEYSASSDNDIEVKLREMMFKTI